MKASFLFKQNIDALLRARGQTRHDLAQWCRRTDAWLSKILGKDDRNLPMKYLDRIADFFGLATYQLFQPGISPLTERRRGMDRRAGRERRVSNRAVAGPGQVTAADLILTGADVALLMRVKSLDEDDRAHVSHIVEMAHQRAQKKLKQATKSRPAQTESTAENRTLGRTHRRL